MFETPCLPERGNLAEHAIKKAHMLDDYILSRGLCANRELTNDFACIAASLPQLGRCRSRYHS